MRIGFAMSIVIAAVVLSSMALGIAIRDAVLGHAVVLTDYREVRVCDAPWNGAPWDAMRTCFVFLPRQLECVARRGDLLCRVRRDAGKVTGL